MHATHGGSGHNGLHAPPAGGAEPAGSDLHTISPEPGLDIRHHLFMDRRRLAVSGDRTRPVQPRSGRLVTETTHDNRHRNRRADDGVVPEDTAVRADPSLGSGQPVRQPSFPGHRLKTYGMVGSMSRKGNCSDNAPTESWFNSLKNERVHGLRYQTRRSMTESPSQFLEDWRLAQHEENRVA